jgi:hypothetical protein
MMDYTELHKRIDHALAVQRCALAHPETLHYGPKHHPETWIWIRLGEVIPEPVYNPYHVGCFHSVYPARNSYTSYIVEH